MSEAKYPQRPQEYEQKVLAVLEAAVAWLDAYDAVQACNEPLRSRSAIEAYEEHEKARRTLRDAVFAAAAAVRDFVSPHERHTAMALENERLRAQVAQLRYELNDARICAERRNRDLDALHLVWCNGGCTGGVHRYCGRPEDVTEAVVEAAERNTARLREWWTNYHGRAQTKIRERAWKGGAPRG